MDISKHLKKIKGNDYLMVAGRVILAHETQIKEDSFESISIKTEFVPELTNLYVDEKGNPAGYVTIQATVKTPKGVFTGHSTAFCGLGHIEGSAPIEVAETSAIGRALGFAGYGTDYGIASAEEMYKVGFSDDSRGGSATETTSRPATSASTTAENKTAATRRSHRRVVSEEEKTAVETNDQPIDRGRKRAIEQLTKNIVASNPDFSLEKLLQEKVGKDNVDDLTVSEAIGIISELNQIFNS